MTEPAAWTPLASCLPACGVDHAAGGAGRLDETARRLDHPELTVARRLVAEGHDVVTLAERGRRGPVPDFLVCGQPVEIKCLLRMAERADGSRATAATVHNRLASAIAQAAVVIVSTEGSGCRAADAAAGVRSFVASRATGKVAAIRVLGDGFDLGWRAPPERAAAPAPAPARPGPQNPDRTRSPAGRDRPGRSESRQVARGGRQAG